MFPGTIPAYTVSPSPDGEAFDVEIATSTGICLKVGGFRSRADAEGWIAEDRRMTVSIGSALDRSDPRGSFSFIVY
jgi:hypothetical protein